MSQDLASCYPLPMARTPLFASTLAFAALSLAGCASLPTSDVVYTGPVFLSSDGPVGAIRVGHDGIIRELLRAPRPDLETVRLPGALALPGLVDAHIHLAWVGRVTEQVDLVGTLSLADVRARVADFAARHPDLAVLVGHGWDQTAWPEASPGDMPRASDLPDDPRPIVLTRIDGHALWLNAAALARLGDALDRVGPETRVLRDPADTPTGLLVDPPASLYDHLIPAPTSADLRRWFVRGLDACADAGLVEVHDMAASPAELNALTALASEARLPLRVSVYLDDSEASFAWLEAHPHAPREVAPDVFVAGVKLFADGALGSRGAALKADYSDEPGHRGGLTEPAALLAKARRAASLGYPVAIHAIGDRANLLAIEAIEAAQTVAPGLVHRIEHAQVLDLADLERLRKSGAVASMQPTHATSDSRWAEARLGPVRIAGAYAWRTLHDRGIPLAFGSDAPVESHRPLLGLYAATTRAPIGDTAWRPEEQLPFELALRFFTQGAVDAARTPSAHRTGRLAVGSLFEVTLLDRDVRPSPEIAPAKLLEALVLGTVRVTDRVVFRNTPSPHGP